MQRITFEYKGTMVKVTGKLKETFEYDLPLATVKEALEALNANYNHNLDKYTIQDINIVFKRDEKNSILLNTTKDLDMELGQMNVITFYYPFKGG